MFLDIVGTYTLTFILIYSFYSKYDFILSNQYKRKNSLDLKRVTIPIIKTVVVEFPKILTTKFKIMWKRLCFIVKNNILNQINHPNNL